MTGDAMRSTARPTAVRVRRAVGSPVVAMRLWLRGGSRREAAPGAAWVTARMLAEGTRRRDWSEIAGWCDDRGIVLASASGLETVALALDCLERDWRDALGLLEELVREPRFARDRFDWVVQQGVAELQSLDDDAGLRTAWAHRAQLYGSHAAGRPRPGTLADLGRLEPEHCRTHWEGCLERGGLLAMVGAIDEATAATAATELAGLLGGSEVNELAPAGPGSGAVRQLVATSARDQAHLFVGHLTVTRPDEDLPALEVASVVLGSGSGLSGRIPERVREREGLAYAASATVVAGAGADPGRLVAHVGTSPATCARAEACVREEIERLLEDGISETEFEEARAYLLGRDPFRRETPGQQAERIGEAWRYGLPFDDPDWTARRYAELTREAVEEACRRHVHPAQLKVTIGLPAGQLEKAPLC